MKLVLVHNIPSPYRVEFFNALAAHPAVEHLHVIFCAERLAFRPWHQRQEWRFSWEILQDYPLRFGHMNYLYHFNPGILGQLARFGRDWVWINYSYIDPTCQIAGIWRTLGRLPWVLMTEAPNVASRSSKGRKVLRRLLLKPAVLGSRGLIVLGTPKDAEYFDEMLLGRLRLFSVPYYLDIAPHLARGRQRTGNWSRPPAAPVKFMYAGQLATYSNVDTIVRAFRIAAEQDETCELHMVGSGAHQPALEAMIPERIRPRVFFRGPKDWQEMPDMYAEADVLVHASLWQAWGMVIPEALASGLAVIGSRTTGAVSQLVRDGVNGFLFDGNDHGSLACHMLHFCRHRELLHKFAQNAVDSAESVTLAKGVQEFVDVLGRFELDVS